MTSYGAQPSPSYASWGAPVGQFDPTSVMGRRIGAYLIDTVIALVVVIVLLSIGFSVFTPYHKLTNLRDANTYCERYNGTLDDPTFTAGPATTGPTGARLIDDLSSSGVCVNLDDHTAYVIKGSDIATIYGILAGGASIVWFLDLVLLQGLTGASLGKMMVGLRVITFDGRRCGVPRALLRSVLLIVDGVCVGIVGLVTAFNSRGHRRVGDMAASTLVVEASQLGHPPAVPGLTSPGFGAPSGGGAPPGFGAPPGVAAPPPREGPTPGHAPPAQGPASSSPPPSTPASADVELVADRPQWDEARQAYITYDSSRAAWLEFDQATSTWKPISR